ncbi:hypothetical protein ABPG72_016557 [Tetrahymena utriculariae]
MDSFGTQYAWIEKKAQIPNEVCIEKKQYPLSVFCWTMISAHGPLSFKRQECTINSESQKVILFKELTDQFYDEEPILQHDNPGAISQEQQINGQADDGIETVKFHIYSLDLSIVENVFGILKKTIFNIREIIENQDQLFTSFEYLFFHTNNIQKSILNAYTNYSNWLHKLIKIKGYQLQS